MATLAIEFQKHNLLELNGCIKKVNRRIGASHIGSRRWGDKLFGCDKLGRL